MCFPGRVGAGWVLTARSPTGPRLSLLRFEENLAQHLPRFAPAALPWLPNFHWERGELGPNALFEVPSSRIKGWLPRKSFTCAHYPAATSRALHRMSMAGPPIFRSDEEVYLFSVERPRPIAFLAGAGSVFAIARTQNGILETKSVQRKTLLFVYLCSIHDRNLPSGGHSQTCPSKIFFS